MANNPEKVLSKCIENLPFHSRILVVGGGADNTVLELLKREKCDKILHVDISNVMSILAKERLNSLPQEQKEKVDFLVSSFMRFSPDRTQSFDAVIFPFYFDLFEDAEINLNLNWLKKFVSGKTSIYIIDFQNNSTKNVWKRIKEVGLYVLFQPITKVKRKSFPKLKNLFEKNGFSTQKKESFFNGFYTFLEFKLNQRESL